MQDVSCAVIAHDVSSLLAIHQSIKRVTYFELTFENFALMTKYISLDLESIFNRKTDTFITEFAFIANLTARFSIKRGIVQNDDSCITCLH